MSCWTLGIHKPGAPFWPGGRAACTRHFEDAYRYIPTNTCIWFTSTRSLWCISCGHLWPWLWGRSGALSITQQQPQEEPRLGTAVQPWHNLPLNLWFSDLGQGCSWEIVHTGISTVKKCASKQPLSEKVCISPWHNHILSVIYSQLFLDLQCFQEKCQVEQKYLWDSCFLLYTIQIHLQR